MTTGRDLILAIETSNPSAVPPRSATGRGAAGVGPGVALGRATGAGADLLGVELLRDTARHDDDLMPAIDRLCRRAGASPRDLSRIAVSVGPGGYTALRIAVATGKMIAHSVGAPCVAVPSAMVVAWRAAPPAAGSPFAVALAGKDAQPQGGTAWVASFPARCADFAAPARNGRLITAADVAGLAVPLLVADRFLPATIRAAADAAHIRIIEPTFDPGACLEIACRALLPDIDPVDLVPLYPREPDAVTLWQARKAGPRPV